MSHAMHLTDANFSQEVLNSKLPVLVDFWAQWCGPCKMLAPIIEELAQEYAGRVKICKLDVDENSAVPGKFGIMSIPTLIFFRDGKVSGQFVGALSRQELKTKIEEYL
jgi:thioredoxin 1